MDGDAAAIVGRAAPVQAGVDYSADERVGVPCAGVGYRLHIVMRVQKHGWRILIDNLRTNDFPSARGTIRIVGLHHLGVYANLAELFGHKFGGSFHMIRGDAFCRNGL